MGGGAVSNGWYSGNAAEDGRESRGWLLGHFIDPDKGVRSSKDVEVKWGIHPVGDKRAEWTADFRIDLTQGSVTLERQGDYAVWGPGIDHSWEALSPSVVVTVRWPSSVS
jgi:hypothetical protein